MRAFQVYFAFRLARPSPNLNTQQQHTQHTNLQEGYAVLPLLSGDLLRTFREFVSVQLSSRAKGLCVQATLYSEPTQPLSAEMLDEIERIVVDMFPRSSAGITMSTEAAEALITKLAIVIDEMLLASAAKCFEELNDVVSVEGKAVGEWLASFNAKPSVTTTESVVAAGDEKK